jgi:transcription elongation factor GreA-like protein
MAISPRQQAAIDLYAAIERVEADALHNITDIHKLKRYQNCFRRITLHLIPRLRKMGGMYASNTDIRKGDYVHHAKFGKGKITGRSDTEVTIKFKDGRESVFVLAFALTKLRRLRTVKDDIAGPKSDAQLEKEKAREPQLATA